MYSRYSTRRYAARYLPSTWTKLVQLKQWDPESKMDIFNMFCAKTHNYTLMDVPLLWVSSMHTTVLSSQICSYVTSLLKVGSSLKSLHKHLQSSRLWYPTQSYTFWSYPAELTTVGIQSLLATPESRSPGCGLLSISKWKGVSLQLKPHNISEHNNRPFCFEICCPF